MVFHSPKKKTVKVVKTNFINHQITLILTCNEGL